MSSENLFRAVGGWIERTVVGGEQYREGIVGYVFIQKGNPKSLGEAIRQAKEDQNGGYWVEQDEFRAHRPVGPIERSGCKLTE